MNQLGVTVSPYPSSKVVAEYDKIGQKARRMLVGRLYSLELLDKVEKSLEDYRLKSKNEKN